MWAHVGTFTLSGDGLCIKHAGRGAVTIGREPTGTASEQRYPFINSAQALDWLPGASPGLALVQVDRFVWSIANARRIIGYEPQDDSEVVYADEIRELMPEPARQNMVQGEARGGKGSR